LWSRRIDGEHRLVYLVEGDEVVVLQARYHYEKGA
jgi:toxin YoeB